MRLPPTGGLPRASRAVTTTRRWRQVERCGRRHFSEAVQRATQDTNRLGWSFRAFVERPITVDGGDQIVVWPRAFAEKAFPFGVIALAERVATSQGIGIDIIRQECATILEEWVDSEVVEEIPHLNTIITEADQKTRFKGAGYRNKQTDWLLVEDKFVVALEARHRPYSYKAQAVGDLSDLERDIELSIVNKIEQCDAALANAANAGLLVSRRPLAVVVNSCPVPVSPVLMHHIEARLAERKITPYRDQHPFQIAVVSAAHLHQIIRGSRRTGRSIGGMVERWRSHPALGDLAFYDWATQHCRKATRNVEVDWFTEAIQAVLGYAIPEDDSAP